MPDGLPAVIDPIELARAGAQLHGRLALAAMPRLAELSRERGGEVRFELEFGRDPHGHWTARGSADCNLVLACQRCLAPMPFALRTAIRLVLVRPGSADGDEAGSEDVLEIGGPVSLAELIEDELLLALPMAVMHESADCRDAESGTRAARP